MHLQELLASKDISSYETLRRVDAALEPSPEPAGPYYTGDALQYENAKIDGRVSDDELTGISAFGV